MTDAAPSLSVTSMTSLVERVWAERDVHVERFPLMASPWPTIALSVLYGLIATVWGPAFMRDRKPMDLKNVMLVYNLFLVILSGYMFYGSLVYGWLHYNLFECAQLDKPMTPQAKGMAAISWWYFISKFVEFLDTFFMLAKKKFNQVTFLHVYHHLSMPFLTWVVVRFTPGGHASFGGAFNAFVHVVMYSYYFLAALGPAIQPYLWWKRHLTKLQLLQFCAVVSHCMIVLRARPGECNFPWQLSAMQLAQSVLLFALFANFYIQSFRNKQREKQQMKNLSEFTFKKNI